MKYNILSKKNAAYAAFFLTLIGVAVFSKCGKLIIGLDIDEQYSIALAYRIASGDLLITEMWEPHQTSAILPAIFLKIFIGVTGSVDYAVIYLRLIGGFIQGAVSLFWYLTFKKEFGNRKALLSACLFFCILPKWIQSPEFANQEIWFLTFALIFIYRGLNGKLWNWIAASFSMAACVLAYPSTVFVFLSLCIFLVLKRRWKELYLFAATCVLAGMVFIISICSHSSFRKVVDGIGYILADSSHSEKASVKFADYLNDLVIIFSWLALYLAVSFLIVKVFSLISHKRFSYRKVVETSLIISVFDQYHLWFAEKYANPHPSVHFAVAFIMFLICFANREKSDFNIILLIAALSSFTSVIVFSNLDLRASIVHLFPAFLGYILLCNEDDKTEGRYGEISCMLWVFAVCFSYLILVRLNVGKHADLFLVKQKALSGPAKYVYCEYMDGYMYNANGELISSHITSEDNVFLVGTDNMIYMQCGGKISSASIISTPVFDERYTDYFEKTGRIPTKIIVENAFLEYEKERSDYFLHWMEGKYSQFAENEFITIWERTDE